MELIDAPSGRTAAIASPGLVESPGETDPRLDGVAQELSQAVSRGDVSREQADAFIDRLRARMAAPEAVQLREAG